MGQVLSSVSWRPGNQVAVDAIRVLLEAKLDPNINITDAGRADGLTTTVDELSPLGAAVVNQSFDIARLLVEFGASTKVSHVRVRSWQDTWSSVSCRVIVPSSALYCCRWSHVGQGLCDKGLCDMSSAVC